MDFLRKWEVTLLLVAPIKERRAAEVQLVAQMMVDDVIESINISVVALQQVQGVFPKFNLEPTVL